MRIQWIGVNDNSIIQSEYSNFNNPKSLDAYDLNIIDASEQEFWTLSSHDHLDLLNIDDDLLHLKKMISHSSKTTILVLVPRDIYYARTEYRSSWTGLKNNMNILQKALGNIVDLPFNDMIFEPTETQIGRKKFYSDFYFFEGETVLTESLLSEKPTTVSDYSGKVMLTSLDIEKTEDFEVYLQEIGLLNEKIKNEPEWMKGIQMFDDEEQAKNIQLAEEEIMKQNHLIEKSNDKLDFNKRYKSILYTQSDELVEVVFEMITEMFDVDLTRFVDNKKEDIAFMIDDEYFIGEIKGISDNVKASRLSQLDTHLYHFLDKNKGVLEENVRRLLIINHQKNKPLGERDSIDINQINLAKNKFGSLIIETSILLALFEKFKNNEIQTEEIVRLFRQTGKLTL